LFGPGNLNIMIADSRFANQDNSFWAHVRSISQKIGYTDRATGQIRIPTSGQVAKVMSDLKLESNHLMDLDLKLTPQGKLLLDYFEYRADILNNEVQNLLMDAEEAVSRFEELLKNNLFQLPLTMNKQKGDKAIPSPLTNVVNILISLAVKGSNFNFNPQELTTFTKNGQPIQTLARRVDGAFPNTTNPVAIWEIKEYYFTTTFGSRVADGVYETLLDGLELRDLNKNWGVKCDHMLFVDGRFTWWVKGRSYLCRLIDILNMGLVTEIVFGKEVYDRLPKVASGWVQY